MHQTLNTGFHLHKGAEIKASGHLPPDRVPLVISLVYGFPGVREGLLYGEGDLEPVRLFAGLYADHLYPDRFPHMENFIGVFHPGPAQLRDVDHPLYTGGEFHKGTERHEFRYPTLHEVVHCQVCVERLPRLLHGPVQELPSGKYDVAAILIKFGNEEFIGLIQVFFGDFHIPQVHLTDGTEGPSLHHFHLKAPFDHSLHPSLHRDSVFKGIPQEFRPPDSGNGLGKPDLRTGDGNRVEFQDIPLLEGELPFLIQKLGLLHKTVGSCTRVHKDAVPAHGDNSPLYLVSYADIFIHPFGIGLKKLGKALFFIGLPLWVFLGGFFQNIIRHDCLSPYIQFLNSLSL